MRKLNTIQKREKLNDIYAVDDTSNDGANHQYLIIKEGRKTYDLNAILCEIKFQKGPRQDSNSQQGVLSADLLEIVRDILIGYQSGPYYCRENDCALKHIEEALMWLNKRVDDRIDRNVLGKYEK